VKLENIQIEPYSYALARKLRSAYGEMRHRRGFILKGQTSLGHVCYGEVAPLADFSEETYEQARVVLASLDVSAVLKNEVDNELAAITQYCESLELLPSVRHGVEQLFLDGLSQDAGVSVAQCLNPESATQVETAHLAADAVSALAAVDRGFRTIKLKVGYQEAAEDLRRVEAVRKAVGEGVNIRLDANGAWTPGWAIDVLKRMAPYRIECVEQPVEADDIDGLAWVCEGSPIPVAADESVRTAAQVINVLEKRAAKIVVLKPMFCGGPILTYSLGRLAQERGVKVMITTALDSAIGRASALHVAAALSGPLSIPAGLDTGHWLAEDSANLPEPTGGIIRLSTAAGLGVSDVRVCR
jgi:o-succinylbenzoate synthase